jgi:small subunit ribosomal protein S21
LQIRVNDRDLEKALKILKRQLQKDGLLGELKKRRYYEKPSVKMRRKQRDAQKRRLKRKVALPSSSHRHLPSVWPQMQTFPVLFAERIPR